MPRVVLINFTPKRPNRSDGALKIYTSVRPTNGANSKQLDLGYLARGEQLTRARKKKILACLKKKWAKLLGNKNVRIDWDDAAAKLAEFENEVKVRTPLEIVEAISPQLSDMVAAAGRPELAVEMLGVLDAVSETLQKIRTRANRTIHRNSPETEAKTARRRLILTADDRRRLEDLALQQSKTFALREKSRNLQLAGLLEESRIAAQQAEAEALRGRGLGLAAGFGTASDSANDAGAAALRGRGLAAGFGKP